jgi:hypothetical protein
MTLSPMEPNVSDISCPRHKSIRVCKLYEERPSAAWKNLVSSFQPVSERNYIDDGPDPFIRADRTVSGKSRIVELHRD